MQDLTQSILTQNSSVFFIKLSLVSTKSQLLVQESCLIYVQWVVNEILNEMLMGQIYMKPSNSSIKEKKEVGGGGGGG